MYRGDIAQAPTGRRTIGRFGGVRPSINNRIARIAVLSARSLITAMLAVAVASVALVAVDALAGKKSVEEMVNEARLASLSKESYEIGAQKIEKWQVGNPVEITGCRIVWRNVSKKIPASIACKGWVEALSGRIPWGLGAMIGLDDSRIIGTHIYGYLSFDSVLVPCHALITQAELIDEAAFNALPPEAREGDRADELPPSITIPFRPDLTHFKNLSIHEVRELACDESEYSGAMEGGTFGGRKAKKALEEWLDSFLTQERFQRAQGILESIPAGADRWDVIEALGGRFHTLNQGHDYGLLMDGFLLAAKGVETTTEINEDGAFKAWPFGYLENGRLVHKLDLVFKNDKVIELIEHVSDEELRTHFRG